MNRRNFLASRLAGGAAIVIRPYAGLARPKPASLLGHFRDIPEIDLSIFGGTMPDSLDRKATGILLSRLRLIPVEAHLRRVAFEAVSPATAVASGKPTYFRLGHDGMTLYQGTCGWNGQLRFNTESIVTGWTVSIHEFTISSAYALPSV